MAKAKKEQTPDEAMAKNEKHNDGSMSGLKKTIIGTVGTLVTAGGALLMTYLQNQKKTISKFNHKALTSMFQLSNKQWVELRQ